MKISQLHIDKYRHLENLNFDFTYPDDFHIVEMRNKPLNKICIIGQGATGKTGLLELILDQHTLVNSLVVANQTYTHEDKLSIFVGHVGFSINDKPLVLKKNTLSYNGIEYNYVKSGSFDNFLPTELKKFIYYIKSNLISEKNIEIFTKNPVDVFEKYPGLDKANKIEGIYPFSRAIIFDENVDSVLWLHLLGEILQYRKNFNQKMSELIHKGLLANTNKLKIEFDKWQKDFPNKLEEFAEKFNPILQKLNLEVDVIDTQYSIPIKNKTTDEIVPMQDLSTGTKGLLLSFLPLFNLKTKDSLVLIDEPERSLYPDMQMELMEHYQKLAPNAQFIVATHSPFIAASFEPDERFILFFDKEGKVACRRGSSPIGDDPNDILENDFGVNYINKFGKRKHDEYVELKQKILFEEDVRKKKELTSKLERLGEEYNF